MQALGPLNSFLSYAPQLSGACFFLISHIIPALQRSPWGMQHLLDCRHCAPVWEPSFLEARNCWWLFVVVQSPSLFHLFTRPQGLQPARLPCPFTISQSLPKFMTVESVIPSNHLILCRPLLLPFPASGSFPVSQLFTSGGQSIGASASASVLPVNIQGWFPLRLMVWSPCCYILVY